MADTVTYTRVRNGKTQVVTRRMRSGEIGWARSPIYKRWASMRRRCHEPKAQNYKWYGGKGIIVCDEWRHNFFAFRDWAELSGFQPGMQLDRIDSEKNYEPSNCRWVTPRSNVKRARYGFESSDLLVTLPDDLYAWIESHSSTTNKTVDEIVVSALLKCREEVKAT